VQRPQMSEDASKMEVDDPKATDIPALKQGIFSAKTSNVRGRL